MKRRAVLIAVCCLWPAVASADDNALAYRLFEQGKYAEAAELFTDPGWKGVSMYRSEQYWRAAEAFVRADDAVSIYNLGNCYARLGYFELALQAYLSAVARDPTITDAAVNADLMRKLLAERDGGAQQALAPKTRKIDEIEPEADEEANNSGEPSETGPPDDQRASDDRSGDVVASTEEARQQASEGRSGAGSDNIHREGAAGQSDFSGRSGEAEPENNASGGSRSDDESDSVEAAGMRTALETEQATEQWLNRIRDEPARFLKARIGLEARRRAASGNLAPVGGDEL